VQRSPERHHDGFPICPSRHARPGCSIAGPGCDKTATSHARTAGGGCAPFLARSRAVPGETVEPSGLGSSAKLPPFCVSTRHLRGPRHAATRGAQPAQRADGRKRRKWAPVPHRRGCLSLIVVGACPSLSWAPVPHGRGCLCLTAVGACSSLSFQSPERASSDSPGQRPGNPGVTITSPEGATRLVPISTRQSCTTSRVRLQQRCPRLSHVAPSGLRVRHGRLSPELGEEQIPSDFFYANGPEAHIVE